MKHDIVDRLVSQASADEAAGTLYSHVVLREAAEEIKKLRHENNCLMRRLELIANLSRK